MASENTVLLMTADSELRPSCRVWGTGQWDPPDEREALDWLTLAKLIGWGVTVGGPETVGACAGASSDFRHIVIAGDPDTLPEQHIAWVAARLTAEPVLVVARAAAPTTALARLAGTARAAELITGRSLRWSGSGPVREWRCGQDLDGWAVNAGEGVAVWATLDGAPVVLARQIGRGVVVTLGFHPSRARDRDGAVTALLKHLLVWGAVAPVAWLDLEGTFVLRMDDAGGAQNVHLRSWSYPKLGEAEWIALATTVKQRNARMSIAYSAGWVDDGDPIRGSLEVAGRLPPRIAGLVHPSPLVTYRDRSGHAPGRVHDYQAEFRGMQALRAAGAGEVELHGYTHLHPDVRAWATSSDRYDAIAWYRELGPAAEAKLAALPLEAHPLTRGIDEIRHFFGVSPTTLICPGDEWTPKALVRALDLGISLVSTYYLGLRHDDRFCWTTYVCSPYLDQPGAGWFTAGVPVVGYFHDRDPSLEGIGWVGRWLDRWREAGARKLMDFRELAAAVGRRLRLDDGSLGTHLTVTGREAPALVRPLEVLLRVSGKRPPSRLALHLDEHELSLEVCPLDGELGRVTIPVRP